MKKSKKLSCGIDLGGTKIAAGVVDDAGRILAEETIPTQPRRGFEDVISRIADLVGRLRAHPAAQEGELQGVGVGAAGQIELQTGVIINSPNLKWNRVPFRASLEKAVGVPVRVDNDVRVATLGEYLFGLDSRPSSLYNIFVGTGVGSGFILFDRILRGHANSACEIGHHCVEFMGPPCSCGSRGCLEVFTGTVGLNRMARELIGSGRAPDLDRRVKGDVSRINGKVMAEAARDGDAVAHDLIQRSGAYLGVGLVNVINLFNPEVIVLGGGMLALGDLFLESAYRVVRERAIKSAREATRIQTSRLLARAGILGASCLARVDAQGVIGA